MTTNRIMIDEDAFDHYPYKQARERAKVLKEAQKQGIVDVDPVSLETVKLATSLVKKYGAKMCRDMEKRRAAQKGKSI